MDRTSRAPPCRSSSLPAFAVAMLAVVILPAALTLHTVRASAFTGTLSANASPFGYTVSLLLFLVSSCSILVWFRLK